MSATRILHVLLAAAVVVPGAGCVTTIVSAEAGYFQPTRSRDGHTGGVVHARAGALTTASKKYGVEVDLRIKGAAKVKQLGIGMSGVVFPFGLGVLTPYARAGFQEFQFEVVDGGFGYGMFSPFGEAGVMIRIKRSKYGGGTFLSLSGFAEYDLRFTSQQSAAYWGITLGIVSVTAVPDRALRRRWRREREGLPTESPAAN